MPVRTALSTSRRASRRQSMVSTSPVFFESRSRCITIFSRTQARTARCSKGVVTVRHLSQPCRPSLRWVELNVAPTGTSTIVTVARALTSSTPESCFSPLLTQSPADPRFVLTSPSFRVIDADASVPLILPVTHQKARNYTCALLIFAYPGPRHSPPRGICCRERPA